MTAPDPGSNSTAAADTTDETGATIAVVGPGRMGQGIAQVFATYGHDVRLVDVKDRTPEQADEKFDDATASIRSNLDFLAESGRLEDDPDDILARIETTTDRRAGLDGADWVFEALPEDPDVKTAFLRAAADDVGDAVVATTTSSISIDALRDAVPDPSRLLITHWLNPAFIVPLVEVARSEDTDASAVERTVSLLESVGKAPVVCEDSPGFIGSRVQAAAMNEAVRIYEDGVASADEIDRALRTGVGFRMAAMGLVEFVDLGGVDILYHVDEYLREELGERFDPPESVVDLMDAGERGARDGRGYYDFADADVDAMREERYERLLALLDDVAEPEHTARPREDV